MKYDNLINNLIERLNHLKSLKEQKNYEIVFTVGNTRVYDKSNYYLTPIRIVKNYIISGIVLFSENEGRKVFNQRVRERQLEDDVMAEHAGARTKDVDRTVR